MSLQTWNEEFYPIPASAAKGDVRTAVEHSLRKWEGLRKENLDKHGLMTDEDYHLSIIDKSTKTHVYGVYGDTCALCLYAKDLKNERGSDYEDYEDYDHDYPYCIGCPLDEINNCNRGDSSYVIFKHKGDPEPMIANLKQCLVNIST